MFLQEHLGTIVTGIILLAIVIAIVLKLRQDKKKGKCVGCSQKCKGCSKH